jgi:uncharacterized protein YndB with AHSA1/START domain
MVPDRIEREILIAAPVQRVWELLTTAEHLRAWFADREARIDLRPGGAMVLGWAEHGTFHARVERVEPPRAFAFRWAAESPGEAPRDGNSTLVEFTLAADGEGTRLRVVESGFRGLDVPPDAQEGYARQNTEGWAGVERSLRAYAEGVAA